MEKDGHSWNRLFWLGFPVILLLLWLHQNVHGLSFTLALYGGTLAWILHGVRSLSRASPGNSLLTTYARVHVSMGFAALVMVGLLAVMELGAAGYALALAVWTGLHLIARTIVAYFVPDGKPRAIGRPRSVVRGSRSAVFLPRRTRVGPLPALLATGTP